MAFKSVTTFDILFPSRGPHAFVNVGGRVLYLNPGSRAFQIIPTSRKIYPVSIVPPVAFTDDPAGDFGVGTIQVAATAGSSGMPAGDIRVVECYRRGDTDELSPPSEPVVKSVDGGDTIVITSDTTPPDFIFALENGIGISHREFYVSYPDAPNTYYFWQRIPFTGVAAGAETNGIEVPDDSTTALGMSFADLVLRRELESFGETGVFPSVSTGTFAFGRFIGAGMDSRVPVSTSLVLTSGSRVAKITAALTDDGKFKSSDLYRAIVYTGDTGVYSGRTYTSGEVLAYIKYILDDTTAVLEFAQGVDVETWPYTTISLTNGSTEELINFAFVTRSKTDLFASSVSANEVGGGLTNGLVMWSPINTFRDQQNYGNAGRTTRVGRVAGSLIAVYERGISIMDSEFSTDMPPRAQFMSLSDELGSFNPNAMWGDNDRRLWFIAQGRIWRVDGARVTDVSRQSGVATFFRKFVGGDGTVRDANVSFNAERNAMLVVGLTRVDDDSGDEHTYALYLSMDQQPTMALCPMRWPVPVRCVAAAPCEADGIQFNQWFIASEDNILTFGAPGVYHDTYDGGSAAAISWMLKTGIILHDWKAVLQRIGIVFMNAANDFSINCDIEVFESGDLSSARTISHTFTRAQISKDLPPVNRANGRAIRVTLSGTNKSVYTALLRTGLFITPEKPVVA